MRDIISREFPDHGIVGEEFGSVNEGADFVWVLDPIDGTRAFIVGLPLWGTLIGLQHLGKPILGIMDQPFTGERFWNDSERRGTAARTASSAARRAPAPISPTPSSPRPPPICSKAKTRFASTGWPKPCACAGSAATATLLHARSRPHRFVVEAKLKPFDILPLIPIVEKAGGVVRVGGRTAPAGGRSSRAAIQLCSRWRWRS